MRLTQITKPIRLAMIREHLSEAKESGEFDNALALLVKAQAGWEDTSSEEIFAVVQEIKGGNDDE